MPSGAYRDATFSGSPVCRAEFHTLNWLASSASSAFCGGGGRGGGRGVSVRGKTLPQQCAGAERGPSWQQALFWQEEASTIEAAADALLLLLPRRSCAGAVLAKGWARHCASTHLVGGGGCGSGGGGAQRHHRLAGGVEADGHSLVGLGGGQDILRGRPRVERVGDGVGDIGTGCVGRRQGGRQATCLSPRLRMPLRRLTAAWQRTVEAERRAGRRRPPALRTVAAEPALRVRLWATAVCIVAGGGRLCGEVDRERESNEQAGERLL
jgi:hypothetical protein